MTEMQAKEYKANLEKVTEELNQLKKKILAEQRVKNKRLEGLEQKVSQDLNQKDSRTSSSSQIKYTGGGFRMSVENVVPLTT